MEPRVLTPDEVKRWKAAMREMRKSMPDDDPEFDVPAKDFSLAFEANDAYWQKQVAWRDVAILCLSVAVIVAVLL